MEKSGYMLASLEIVRQAEIDFSAIRGSILLKGRTLDL